MKLPSKIKTILLATLSFASIQQASSEIYTWTGSEGDGLLTTGGNWVNSSGSSAGEYSAEWTKTKYNVIRFDSTSAVDTESNSITHNFMELNLGGLIVELGASINAMTLNDTSTRNVTFAASSQSSSDINDSWGGDLKEGEVNIVIKSDFSMFQGTTTSRHVADKVTFASTTNINVVKGSTFTICSLNFDAGGQNINLSGGGEFNLAIAQTLSNAGHWIISDGSTLDLTHRLYGGISGTNNADDLLTVKNDGSFKLDGGHIMLLSGVTIVQDVTITANTLNSIGVFTEDGLRGASLTLDSTIQVEGGGAVYLSFSGDSINIGESFVLNFDGSITEGTTITFDSDNDIDFDQLTFQVDGVTVDFGDYFIVDSDGSIVAIPEPTTATLGLLALMGLCARRRRKA